MVSWTVGVSVNIFVCIRYLDRKPRASGNPALQYRVDTTHTTHSSSLQIKRIIVELFVMLEYQTHFLYEAELLQFVWQAWQA